MISLDNNITFTLHNAIGLVSDSIPITGNLDVQTSGTSVQLNSIGPGFPQYLSGMGVGGGDYLIYSNKPTVTLETYAPNAGVKLDCGFGARRELLHGQHARRERDDDPLSRPRRTCRPSSTSTHSTRTPRSLCGATSAR